MTASRILVTAVALAAGVATASSADTVLVETIATDMPEAIGDDLNFGPDGRIYSSNFGANVYAFTTDGVGTPYADGMVQNTGHAFDDEGYLFVSGGTTLWRVPPGGGTAVAYATLGPALSGVVRDPDGDYLYVVGYTENRVYRIHESNPSDVTVVVEDVLLAGPAGLDWLPDGDLVIASFDLGRLFRLTLDGVLTEFADLDPPGGIGYVMVSGDTIYVTGIRHHRIYTVDLDGTITPFAGTGVGGHVDGPAETAQFRNPNALLASDDGNTIYVSDFGSRSIRKITITETVSTPSTGSVPELLPVESRPNPFRTGTSIRFGLPRDARVRLTVFDATGRRVRRLLDAPRLAGPHAIHWDGRTDAGRSLPAGTYFYRLDTGAGTASGRVLRVDG